MTSAVLDNGLKVLVAEVHTAPLASVWCWYKVGSKDEVTGLTGVSHWVEHMNFKGTTNIPRDQVKGIIEKFGGSWNGYTWIDQTTYMETASTAGLDRMLFIEAERMANCLYDPEDCESERTVIISELQGSENDPDTLLEQEVIAAAYKVHPYRHPTIGWLSDLQTMTRDDLYRVLPPELRSEQRDRGRRRRRRHRRRPAPRREAVRRDSRRPARRAASASSSRSSLASAASRSSREGTTAYLKLAYHAPAVGDPDFFPMLVLDAILTGAKGINLWSSFRTPPPQRSARLYRALVERRLASAVGAGLAADRASVPLSDLRDRDGRRQPAGSRGRRDGGAGRRRARRHHRARAGEGKEPASRPPRVRKRQRHEPRSSARIFSDGRKPRHLSGRAEPHRRRDAGSGECASRRNICERDRRTVGWFRPTDGAAGMTTAVQKGLAASRHVLGNGTVVISKEAPTVPAVTIQVGVKAGSIYDSNALRRPEPSRVARARPRHPRTQTTEEIAEALDERGVSLTVGANRHVMTVSCTCLSEDFEAMLDLVGEIVMQPAFPEREIEKRKGEVLNAIRQDEDNPAAMAMQALFAMLYPRPASVRPSVERALSTSVSRIERKDLVAVSRCAICAGDDNGGHRRRCRRASSAVGRGERVFGSWRKRRPARRRAAASARAIARDRSA